MRQVPGVLAFIALEMPGVLHRYIPPFYSEILAVHQSLRHLLARRLDDPAESLSGDSHLLGRLLLIHALKVSEPDRLQLVHREQNVISMTPMPAVRSEATETG
jgi:hypothetical protein